MKITCAWCGRSIGYTCDHCGEALVQTEIIGATRNGVQTRRVGWFCQGLPGNTPLAYDYPELMKPTYGICAECVALTTEDRDTILTKTRNMLETLGKYDAETVRETLLSQKKRGPTGVSKSATTPTEPDPTNHTDTAPAREGDTD